AVHDEHGNFQAREFAACVVFDGAQQANGEPRVELPADLGQARECALQDEAADWLARAEFAGDAAAEGFAVDDDVVRCETFLAEPLIRGLGVEIGSFFARAAFAQAVAAVIERENVGTESEQRLVEAKAMADVAAVAVAIEENKLGTRRICGCGIEPTVE